MQHTLASGQEGEKTLVQVCWFIPFVGYPPKTKACPWSHYPDIAGCFNPQLFTSLSPSLISFSLALSLALCPPSISLESFCYKLTCGDNG